MNAPEMSADRREKARLRSERPLTAGSTAMPDELNLTVEGF